MTVSTGLAIAIKGGQASTLRVPGEGGYLIRVRYPENERRSIKDLMCIYVSTKSGTAPLGEPASLVKTRTRFTRQGLERLSPPAVVAIGGLLITTFLTLNICAAVLHPYR